MQGNMEEDVLRLLELAADNDVNGFKQLLDSNRVLLNEDGPWYCRKKGSKLIVSDRRTPLMVSATYGSIDVMKMILSFSDVDVNKACGDDLSTPLHCAAASGVLNAVDAVKMLLAAGAEPCSVDASGLHPVDVISVPPKLDDLRWILEDLLAVHVPVIGPPSSGVSMRAPGSLISVSLGNGLHVPDLDCPVPLRPTDATVSATVLEKKEYPLDPSLPDIKNIIYSTDEFRMYSFKIRPCSRAYSHDWTECPFVHPGENARRRDPRKFHYSCVPCPDFRKGACRRGDMCEYAHGVFECWLHPAQYRTRICKDGTGCARRVCFFAHTIEELRPLYVSTGSGVPSPPSTTTTTVASVVDYVGAMGLYPPSPSSMPVMSPSFTPPMSPSANSVQHASPWIQSSVPSLHLPGSNLQASRLKSSVNARDIPPDYSGLLLDFGVDEMPNLAHPSLRDNIWDRSSNQLRTLTPTNLEDLFSSESSSPFSDQTLASAFSPNHKSVLMNHFHQQSLLSPLNTSFSSSKSTDTHPFFQSSFASGRISPRNMEPVSPMSARVSMLAHGKPELRSHSFRERGSNSSPVVGSPVNSWSNWGNSNGKPDWKMGSDQSDSKVHRSNSFELLDGDGPDLSWVHSLVKESPPDAKDKPVAPVSGGVTFNTSSEIPGSKITEYGPMSDVIGSWIEQLHIEKNPSCKN